MKKLQNNFTTPEQSKRLLELGVPADSADCYWNDISLNPIPMQEGILYSDKRNQFTKVNVPVWSVGRLIEIYKICNPADFLLEAVHLGLDFDLTTILMTSFEAAVGVGCMDFSKLKDYI